MSGSVNVQGSISYVSQEPWMFSGTLKENILFGEKFDRIWYEKVLDACSLDEVRNTQHLYVVYGMIKQKIAILGHTRITAWRFYSSRRKGGDFEWRAESQSEFGQGDLP